jgi:hypothetical protein
MKLIAFSYFRLNTNIPFECVAHILFRNSECKLAHIYGMNKGKVFISCVLYTNGYVKVNE